MTFLRKRMMTYFRNMMATIVILLIFNQNVWATQKQAKYIFLFIGDGMGIPQKAATSEYLGRKLLMDTFPAQGITTTYAADRFITGSAASATALATGFKTNINYISVDTSYRPVKTIAEMAKDDGKKVGIISSVSIDHATPAAFYAHVKTRKMYHEIDVALAKSGFDFFGGGGLMDPTGKNSKEAQGDALEMAKSNGYQIVSNKRKFMQLKKGSGKVIAWNPWLQDSGAIPYAMDMGPEDITLPEFTEKAIELLDNPDGFFLMVEGGKIDWAAHANDAAATITNNIAFDDAVGKALDFYDMHPEETLIVVTGDHECGGLTLGFAGTKYASHFSVLKHQKVSFQKFSTGIIGSFKKRYGTNASFQKMKSLITKNFGLKFSGNPKEDIMALFSYEIDSINKAFDRTMAGEKSNKQNTYILYGDYDPLTITITHILNQKAGLGWTSFKHTGVPISTSAIGIGQQMFNGMYDNTDVALKIMQIMGKQSGRQYL